jgi:hypothetical protein
MDELEDIMINKISQSQEDKYGMFRSCAEFQGERHESRRVLQRRERGPRTGEEVKLTMGKIMMKVNYTLV